MPVLPRRHADVAATVLIMARILVVDDNEQFAELTVRTLRSDGHEVEYARPIGSTNKVLQFNPDLILLDLLMPGISGVNLSAQYTKYKKVRIVLYSSADERKLRDAASTGSGVIDHWSKSVLGNELIAKVRLALMRQSFPA